SYTQATGVVTITFAGSTNAAAAELVLENITYGIDASDNDPSTTARTVTLNTVTDNGGGADTNTDISETATISVNGVNDVPVLSRDINIDFANYTLGGLDGQNGWAVERFNTADGIAVTAGAGDDGSAAITFETVGPGAGNSASLVGASALPDMTSAQSLVIEWSAYKSYWGSTFALGYDADFDGQILRSSGEQALSVTFAESSGLITVKLPDESTIAVAHSLPSGWIDFRWDIDLTANGGQGSGTLYFKSSTLGQSQWQTDAAFTAINLGLDPLADDKTNAENWDGIYLHFEGANNGLDNYHFAADAGSGVINYVEGSSAIVLDPVRNVIDADLDALNGGLGNYDGASVTLVRNGGASADDVFSNSGLLGTLTESGALDYNGTTIGTVTTNSGGTLVLTFNTNATTALVDSTLQSIAYSNSSDTPPASAQIDWSFDDGDASVPKQATGSTTVTITAVNDKPTVDLNGTNGAGIDFATTFTEGGGAVNVTDTDAIISDVDDTSFQALGINLSGMSDGASELVTVVGYTFTYGTNETVTRTVGSTDFEIDFDGTGFSIAE
ncbi:MAG: hypothetical protein GY792_22375, partial [Gammaproteobacteria bacterium]|nr:hypothetical protein [Gammaproteobacteria bacterium]